MHSNEIYQALLSNHLSNKTSFATGLFDLEKAVEKMLKIYSKKGDDSVERLLLWQEANK